LATLAPALSGKQLELLKEVERAAKAFGVKLQFLDVLGPNDIEAGFHAASKARADTVLIDGNLVFLR
jgi:hypothetical protein